MTIAQTSVPSVNKTLIIIIACLSMILSFSVWSTPDVNIEEKFVRNLFNIIIKKDSKSFSKMVVTTDDIIGIEKKALKQAKKDKNTKKYVDKILNRLKIIEAQNKEPKNIFNQVIKRVNSSLTNLYTNAQRDGVDLAKVKYGRIIHLKVREQFNQLVFGISFTVLYADKKYVIRAKDLYLTSRGLVMLDEVRWKGKRRQHSLF